MKKMIRAIVAITLTMGISTPTLTTQAATTVNFLNPNQVTTKVFQNNAYYEFGPIQSLKPSQKWGVQVVLAPPSAGVKSVIWTLKGGTFANGKTKMVVTSSKKTSVISEQSHVYLYLKNYVPVSYIMSVVEKNAIEQGKTTYIYPAPGALLLGHEAAAKKIVHDLMHYETPSLVYIRYASVVGTKNDTVFKFKYFETVAQLKTVKEKVKDILAQILKPSMDVYQKEFAIHNWIASHVSYDFTKAGRNEQDYSALTKHKADCSGVTELTYQMLTAAGITNRMVPGNVHGGSSYVLRGKFYNKGVTVVGSDTAHIWNEVDLNGKWYMLDVTQDLANTNKGKVSYTGYNLTSAELLNTHTWDQARFLTTNTNFVSVLQHSKNPQDKQILHAIEG